MSSRVATLSLHLTAAAAADPEKGRKKQAVLATIPENAESPPMAPKLADGLFFPKYTDMLSHSKQLGEPGLFTYEILGGKRTHFFSALKSPGSSRSRASAFIQA